MRYLKYPHVLQSTSRQDKLNRAWAHKQFKMVPLFFFFFLNAPWNSAETRSRWTGNKSRTVKCNLQMLVLLPSKDFLLFTLCRWIIAALLPTLTPPLFFRLFVEYEKLKQEEPQSKPFCIYLTYASHKEPIESIWTNKSDLLMLVQT